MITHSAQAYAQTRHFREQTELSDNRTSKHTSSKPRADLKDDRTLKLVEKLKRLEALSSTKTINIHAINVLVRAAILEDLGILGDDTEGDFINIRPTKTNNTSENHIEADDVQRCKSWRQFEAVSPIIDKQ